jgi:nucleoid-associated protein EbfC
MVDGPDPSANPDPAPAGLPDLAGLGGGVGLGAPDDAGAALDMGSLLGMAMDMQQQMLAAQEQAAHTVVEGQAGGGVVRIEVTGGMEFRSVTIDRDAVDPDDVEMLQDLVLAALHDAVSRVNDLAQAANPMAGLGMGDLDLGGLGGMLGLGADAAAGADITDDEDQDDDDDDAGPGPAAR